MTTDEPAAPRARADIALPALLLLIAVVHLPLLGFGLIYDDGWTLRSNGFLRPGHFDPRLLFSPEAVARHIPDGFRPTLVCFDALSYRLLGLDPRSHHALSILLHVGVCALLARCLRQLGAGRALTLAATACFGLLAIHAEVVAVISYREDLLAALLGLGALSCALQLTTVASGSRRVAWSLAAMIAMALACGAKLSAAPLPALLLLLVWLRPLPFAGFDRRGALTLALVALGLGVALAIGQNLLIHGALSPYGADNLRVYATRVGLGPVLAASTQIHVGYLQQILLPLGLSPEYVDYGAAWSAPATVAASAVLASLSLGSLVILVRSWRGRPNSALAITGAAAFLGWLLLCLPTSNLVGLPNMRADRFMYLPSLPLCVAIAAGLLALGRRLMPEQDEQDEQDEQREQSDPRDPDRSVDLRSPWLPLALFCLLQASLGVAAARTYVSNATLWRVAIRKAPDSARAHALLALERLATGRYAEGLAPGVDEVVARECRIAAALDPRYELPLLCLAELAVARKDWAAAFEWHQRAIEVSVDRNDRSIAAQAQLALDLPSAWLSAHPELDQDRRELARTLLARGLRAYPYSPELHAAAAQVHHRIGEPERALARIRRARSLRPERWETVALGVELTLDLGDAAAAHHTWWAQRGLLAGADPGTRTRILRRLAAARTNPDFSLIHSLFSPGVFPDDP